MKASAGRKARGKGALGCGACFGPIMTNYLESALLRCFEAFVEPEPMMVQFNYENGPPVIVANIQHYEQLKAEARAAFGRAFPEDLPQ